MRRIAPSTAISLLALVISLGGAGYAATGGTFVLGFKNLADSTTGLKTKTAGYAMLVQNTGGPALALIGAGNKAPLSVNSAVKVKNLNADFLDGLDSSRFPTITKVLFSLAPGATSAPIPVPANVPIRLVGGVTTFNYDSTGAITLFSSAAYLSWLGLESISSKTTPTVITSGFGSDADVGKHVLFLDYYHNVDVELATATSIRVYNGSSSAKDGYLSFTY